MSAYRRSLPATGALVLALAALPAAHAADSASGYFRMGDNRVELAYGCGYQVEGDEGNQKLLFLADRELDCAAAQTALDPESVLEDQVREAKGGYVRILYNPKTETPNLYYSLSEPSDSFNTAGYGTWTETVATDERSEGSWKIDTQEFFDKTYDCDLHWSLALDGAPVRGQALPAGGGEPGKALEAYVKAVVGDDTAGFRAHATGALRDDALSNEGTEWFADQWKYFKEYELAEVEILGGKIDGERATLQVKGKQGDGEKVEGRVRLVREDGAWKVLEKNLSYSYD